MLHLACICLMGSGRALSTCTKYLRCTKKGTQWIDLTFASLWEKFFLFFFWLNCLFIFFSFVKLSVGYQGVGHAPFLVHIYCNNFTSLSNPQYLQFFVGILQRCMPLVSLTSLWNMCLWCCVFMIFLGLIFNVISDTKYVSIRGKEVCPVSQGSVNS